VSCDDRGRIVGIVPAAGSAARLQPLPCSKEVLTVAGRPVMDYTLERMAAGKADRIVVVTRPDKRDVIEHAGLRGASVLLARPATLGASLAAGLQGSHDDDIALIGFPDSLWEPMDGFVGLIEEVRMGARAALGLFSVDEPWRSDVVTVDDRNVVTRIDIKPTSPPSSWIWGCAAVRVGALSGMDRHAWPSEHLREDLTGRRVVARRLSRAYLDIGTPAALAAAERWAAEHLQSIAPTG
jgi:NDP-sugar pyrophosphorylase family protein